jgi:hypothetical protein
MEVRVTGMNEEEAKSLCEKISQNLNRLIPFENQFDDILNSLDYDTEEVMASIMIARGYVLGDIEISASTIPFLQTADLALEELLDGLGA